MILTLLEKIDFNLLFRQSKLRKSDSPIFRMPELRKLFVLPQRLSLHIARITFSVSLFNSYN